MRRWFVVLLAAAAPIVGSWACGGGEAESNQNTAPLPSSQPSSAPTQTASATPSAAPTPSATASAAPVTLPPEFTTASDKFNVVMKNILDVFTSNEKNATAATCDKIAAAVLKIAKDPDSKKTAMALAAESVKLTDAQHKAVLDANVKSGQAQLASMPNIPSPDGGALCEHNKKFGDMAAAVGELLMLSTVPPSTAKKP